MIFKSYGHFWHAHRAKYPIMTINDLICLAANATSNSRWQKVQKRGPVPKPPKIHIIFLFLSFINITCCICFWTIRCVRTSGYTLMSISSLLFNSSVYKRHWLYGEFRHLEARICGLSQQHRVCVSICICLCLIDRGGGAQESGIFSITTSA